jgi:ankyrin repeat protein
MVNDLSKTIYLPTTNESLSLNLQEVPQKQDDAVCIEGRFFKVLATSDNPIHLKEIQNKIQSLSTTSSSFLTLNEFICKIVDSKQDLPPVDQTISTLQASYLKKEQQKFNDRIEIASQEGIYNKLFSSLEQTDTALEGLRDQSSELSNTHFYSLDELEHITYKALQTIQTVAAEIKLKQVDAQIKERHIEKLETMFKLHQILPVRTELEKQKASSRLDDMLVLAIITEHVAYANQLIHAGTEINVHHLWAGVVANSDKLIDILVKAGCNPDSKTNTDKSMLSMACLRGAKASKAIDALVRHGASLTSVDSQGYTPITEAIMSDLSDEKVLKLLDKLQKPNFQDAKGDCLLHEAITRIKFDRGDRIFNYLLDVQKATPNVKDSEGQTPLHRAIEYLEEKALPIVTKLIKKDAIVSALDNKEQTPLHYAARVSNVLTQKRKQDTGKITKSLIQAGAPVNAIDNEGRTALHEAVRFGGIRAANTKTLAELIKGGAALNIQDHDGNTALHLAAEMEHVDMVKLLLKHGANRNLRNKAGRLPGAMGFCISETRKQKILDLLAKIESL